MSKDAVLRKMGRAVSGRLQLPATTRLVRYAAAREYEDGNLAEAKRLYEKLSESGHDTASRLRLGVIAERQERFEAALRTYTEVAYRDPSCGEAFYRAGCLLKRQDDPEGASVFFSRALSSGVRDRRYSENLLACLPASTPQWQRLEVLLSGLPEHENDAAWLRKLLQAQLHLGLNGPARCTLDALADIDELSAQELFEQGVIAHREGDRASAAASFAAACKAAGGKACSKGPAQFACSRGDWRLAAELFEIYPGEGMTRVERAYELAYCLDRLREHERAQGQYALAASLDTGNGNTLYKLGLASERVGDLATAERSYQEALRTLKKPARSWWNYRRGVCLARLGRHDEALASFWAYLGPAPRGLASVSKQLASTGFLDLVRAKSTPPPRQRPEDLVESTIGDVMLGLHEALSSHNPTDDPGAGKAIPSAAAGQAAQSIRHVLPLVLKGDRNHRLVLAQLAQDAGQVELACEILEQAEEFGCKDGLDPRAYGRTATAARNIRYAEALEVLPVSPHLVLWESNHGASIGCHPLAIFRWMVDRPEYSHLLHVWAVNDLGAIPADLLGRRNVVFVPLHSTEYMQYLATAGYLVNNVSFAPYFVRRREQRYLNTWHGTPFKTLGRSMRGGLLDYENLQRNFQLSTTLMAPNELTRWALVEDHDLLDVYRGRTIVAGSPRLDTSLTMSAQERTELRGRLGLAEDDERRLVLFAPTWRGGVSKRELDREALVADLTAMASRDDVLVVYRAHRLSEKLLAGVDLPVSVVPKDIDTNELLAAVDVLVTDYSSILFDFLPQKRPIVLYMHDIEEYRAERGLYLDPGEVPGLACYDRAELASAIGRALAGEGVAPQKALDRYCPYEDGQASSRLARAFFDDDLDHGRQAIIRDHALEPASGDGSRRRRTLLFHASMIPNGIASALLALLEALDPDLYSVNLIVEPSVLRNNEDRQAMFRRLPRHVHVICKPGAAPWRIHERACVNDFARHPDAFTSQSFWDCYWAYYERETRRILGDFVPDAAIEYDGYAETWVSLIAAWGRRGSRTSCYQHNQMDNEYRDKYPGLRRVFTLYSAVDAVVAVSPGLARHNRSGLAGLGVDLTQHQLSARNLLNVERVRRGAQAPAPEAFTTLKNEHDIVLATMGRMSMEKNQVALIEALALLRKQDGTEGGGAQGLNVGLAIVGSGVLEATLRARIDSLGLSGHVALLGQMDNPFPVLGGADLFVLPSLHEGQPVTLLEAMTLGTGVVASDLPGNRELIDLGYGVLSGTSPQDIAQAIRSALADPRLAHGAFDVTEHNARSLRDTLEAVLGPEALHQQPQGKTASKRRRRKRAASRGKPA
ncbi:CDP-glycerol glycerophosphotransferase family protein [Actinomyces sp. HMT 175]|uniref:CDP-glycerol glycerophosphotransferase family protein n=1 Tax=Actinomyces sp. HMT 175 TaxID=2789425 RepID=UPI0019172813|nr:CDP-glycerol glycerophosphotransferase family protein [Actinomyces sp. HMT 175]QQQ60005.1 CDP-glycerol glycerophosphotransferase family protein [Actinomyces sp. HMT 175]